MADYTIRTAARHLGVTPQTIRRRLERGDLSGMKVAGKYGPEWRVCLDDACRSVSTRASRTQLCELIVTQSLLLDQLWKRLDALEHGKAVDPLVLLRRA